MIVRRSPIRSAGYPPTLADTNSESVRGDDDADHRGWVGELFAGE